MIGAGGTMIYYLHPLLAGPLEGWARHFKRIAALGFRKVLVAPPFLPGRSGDIFLTADFERLHPLLGESPAPAAFRSLVAEARLHGLELLLNLVIGRVARETASDAIYAPAISRDLLPDPRLPPPNRFAAVLRVDADPAAIIGVWQPLIAEWIEAGIAGFRCEAAAEVPPAVWTGLIDAARLIRPETLFIAWTQGASAAAVRGLAGRGFDLVTSSSFAWDFRADWLEAESAGLAGVGGLLTMPSPPFAAAQTSDRDGKRRAMMFAAAYGEAWLLPMGGEFGADTRVDPARATSAQFEALEAAPEQDLRPAVIAANALHSDLAEAGPGRIVSPPYAAIAGIARGDRLILVNPSTRRSHTLQTASLLPNLDASLPASLALPLSLSAGEVRVIELEPSRPILLATGEPIATAIAKPRIAIEAVAPNVDNGRFPAKQMVGTDLVVTADIVCDGHDKIGAALLWRAADETQWHEVKLQPLVNDRWTASFPLQRVGRHVFAVEAWDDRFASYQYEIEKKHAVGLNLDVEIAEGLELVARIAQKSGKPALQALEQQLAAASIEQRLAILRSAEMAALVAAHDPREHRVRSAELPVDAERRAASFSSWYEIFPRSQSETPGQHGSFADVIRRLPSIRDMGFDVLYFPPIHPIGKTNRKGPNNTLTPGPTDPGSPYAIGSAEGGHDAVHPELGTLDDFKALITAATAQGLEIAIDFAIQCSPDHPWLREHPEWFTWRPDGSIRYAENPPKRYEDIVNVAFYADGAMPGLWTALRDVVQFWVDAGVRIFRVDNPHTKPLPFWEWMIGDIRGRHPDAMFLAEAFTKPKMMYRLGKVGFSQSYTYFTWRDSAWDMRKYLEELTTEAPQHFYRPHFFVNTPDINPIFLHNSGRPGFLLRAALAATLSGLWGVYNGFELCEGASLNGREEYLDSEKYQLRHWDHDRPGNIVAEIRRLNQIRRSNPALHSHLGVQFMDCGNDNVLCFVKATANHDNVLVVAVSFDPHNPQEAHFDLQPAMLGLAGHADLLADDLMRNQTVDWHTGHRHVRLDPSDLPFAIWRVRPTAEEQ